MSQARSVDLLYHSPARGLYELNMGWWLRQSLGRRRTSTPQRSTPECSKSVLIAVL